jgi:hypothetical protein
MCFSAAASFATAALLLPAGAEALRRCRSTGRSGLFPLSFLPLGFALQQALEGFVWRNLSPQTSPGLDAPGGWLTPLALAYLFFAYGLWPAWIPWCALCAARGRVGPSALWALRGLLALGLLGGLALWLPLLLDPALAGPVLVRHSLHYGAVELLGGTPLAGKGPVLYLLLIAVPLLLVPSRGIQLFGTSLALSSLLAYGWWQQAFSSVWCFFSALLSLQLLWILRAETPPLAPLEVPA